VSAPVPVKWNPVIARMERTGQLYAISGSVWIPVPDGTTRADLPRYMAWQPAASVPESTANRSWTVPGSRGQTYNVRERAGYWTCECKGFMFRRKCRHIESKKGAA
jgi:hypothetical protein